MTFARSLPRAMTAHDIAGALASASIVGDPARVVDAIGSLTTVRPGILAFCDAADAASRVERLQGAVVLVPADLRLRPGPDRTLIAVADVRAAFIDLVSWLVPDAARPRDPAPGVDGSARVDTTASIAPSACIGARVEIGARSRVAAGAVVYEDCVIGSDCVIGPNAVVGWVGLAYHDRQNGERSPFPHLAGVRIGHRVDVGAQAAICRGMLSHTTLDDDVKIGSLVYVGHGVTVGAGAWLSASASIAGHAAIGDRALLGIGTTVVDNVRLEPAVVSGAGSVVARSVPAGTTIQGVPARPVPAMRRFGPTPRQ